MNLMSTFESLSQNQQSVVTDISDAARQAMRNAGILPRNDDAAAIFDEACAKFYVESIGEINVAVRSAQHHLEKGNPVECASALDQLLKNHRITLAPEARTLLEKAHEEITIGTPEKARAYIELLPKL